MHETRAGDSSAMIRAEGLVKHYGEVRAVDGVSFSIARGEIVGFLGPNGAGKSTTMRMLTGYLYPDAGSVEIAGHPLDGDDLAARAQIGYLPEHTPLYLEMRVDRYLSFVAEVRGLGSRARRDAIARVVEAAGLDHHTTRRIRTLSKGYRQRVGLAQALIADPDVLVLDEPTSGLDPVEIVRIRERIRDLAETKTVLLSTHVLPEVEEICRRAIIIVAGQIERDASLHELSEGEGEALAVTLTLAGADADERAALQALAGLEGVQHAQRRGRDDPDRVRFHLEVHERFRVAERVSALAHQRGWALVELRHDVPTLERVFLSCMRAAARTDEQEAPT